MKSTSEIKNFDHVMWIAKLKQYKNELVNLESKLEDLAGRSKQTDFLARIEHFQNQLIVQKGNVNDLIHAIKMDQKNLRYEMVMNTPELELRKTGYPPEKERAEVFERIMKELMAEFERFAAKWKK